MSAVRPQAYASAMRPATARTTGSRLSRPSTQATPDAAERAVYGRAPGQPRGRGVRVHLAQVVMAVPLQLGGLDAGGGERLDEPRDAARERRLAPRQPQAERVAQPQLHRDAAVAAEL